MARLGLSALKSLLRRAGLRRSKRPATWQPPAASWSRPLGQGLSLIHISEPTRPERISYAVFCLKKKK